MQESLQTEVKSASADVSFFKKRASFPVRFGRIENLLLGETQQAFASSSLLSQAALNRLRRLAFSIEIPPSNIASSAASI